MISTRRYQEESNEFAILHKTDTYARSEAVAGLAGEVGELCEIYKRRWRGDNGSQVHSREERTALVKEMGDVLWYLSRLATLEDITLDEIMGANLSKLNSRKYMNTIMGKGDER